MAILTKKQTAVMNQIASYGKAHGYNDHEIFVAQTVAFKESSLGENIATPNPTQANPNPTASGLYQYTDKQWETSSPDGDKSSNADQIAAFFDDITKYSKRYDNLPDDKKAQVSKDEYIYIKHHDGPNADDFSDNPDKGKNIWDKVSDEFKKIIGFIDEFLSPAAYGATIEGQVSGKFGESQAWVWRGAPLAFDPDGDGLETTGI